MMLLCRHPQGVPGGMWGGPSSESMPTKQWRQPPSSAFITAWPRLASHGGNGCNFCELPPGQCLCPHGAECLPVKLADTCQTLPAACGQVTKCAHCRCCHLATEAVGRGLGSRDFPACKRLAWSLENWQPCGSKAQLWWGCVQETGEGAARMAPGLRQLPARMAVRESRREAGVRATATRNRFCCVRPSARAQMHNGFGHVSRSES
ncbi:uncharacterized protein LOC118935533 isoform X1 [Manis pentadactyla]|uniref:uncharacterized protein LOC118935533 isoform X1 n=1 Tax=Manis pentadactyla TaxID=143292 RepID=UPI00255CF355|nr:uncharacterized protein LOC118935533 isoform X1 [Manis pentadactyla]